MTCKYMTQAPTALDPGPEFPPLVAPVDVDGGREHPGHTEDADDMDGHDEPVLMDGEDEEMFMLHVRCLLRTCMHPPIATLHFQSRT